LAFSLLSFIPTAITQEKGEGTVKMTLRFMITALVINTLVVLIAFALSFVYPIFLKMPSIGLWPIIFCDIVIVCN
jgi:hypothetical protein